MRTDAEVAEGFIPNSVNIDIYKGQGFIDEIEKMDKSKTYYVYCRSGNRSGQACAIMNGLGFEKAYNNIGLQYYEIGEKDKALLYYEKALELTPNSASAYNNLGNLYCGIKNVKKAFTFYKKAITIYNNT